jgi:FMNH2-dependent dimethyl sulfone monooxygenase
MQSTGPMFNDNKLKLGIFSANCSGGMAVTKVEERWQNSWENNLELVRLCDDAGLEWLWRGHRLPRRCS